MNLKQVTHRLALPSASVESLQERRYWLQCERTYTYQPIYRTDGRLLAVELLTIVTHPSDPSRRIAPERYFAGCRYAIAWTSLKSSYRCCHRARRFSQKITFSPP